MAFQLHYRPNNGTRRLHRRLVLSCNRMGAATRQLNVEPLESRNLLATYTVNDGTMLKGDGDLDNPSCDIALKDEPPTGICTFLAARGQSNRDGGGEIRFTSGLTVSEGGGIFENPVTIDGGGNVSMLVSIQLHGSGSAVRGVNFVGGDLDVTAGGSTVEESSFVDQALLAVRGGGNVIRKNEFRNSTDGIDLECANNSMIVENTLIGGDFIGITSDSVGCDGSGNTIQDNHVEGFSLGIVSDGDNTSVIGNVVVSNRGKGISLVGDGVTVEGNFVGTNPSSATGMGNVQTGVTIFGNNARVLDNVISGNGSTGLDVQGEGQQAVVRGNRIGTNPSGTAALPNGGDGMRGTISDGRIEDNVISGNSGNGVFLGGDRNVIRNNRVGTDLAGIADLGNGLSGWFLNGSDNQFGGTSNSDGNVVSANGGVGLVVGALARNNTIEGNRIGTDAGGMQALGNESHGIVVAGVGNTIGGTSGVSGAQCTGACNLISANKSGIRIVSRDAADEVDTTVQGNFIGTNSLGDDPNESMGNTDHGIWVERGSKNKIGGEADGEGNIIAFNGRALGVRGHGVLISAGERNAIRRNSMYSNKGRGIDLVPEGAADSFTLNDVGDTDTGANQLQNFPEVWSLLEGGQTQWILSTSANQRFTVEFFGNEQPDPGGFGEGKEFLGSLDVQTDGLGTASFLTAFPDRFVAATVTDANGNTSEFSMVDTDADAIADRWEAPDPESGQGGGIDIDEDGVLDLDMGTLRVPTNPEHKDLLVEVDAMSGHAFDVDAQRLVEQAFAEAPNQLVRNPDNLDGVTLHIVQDETNLPVLDPIQFDAGNTPVAPAGSFDALKRGNGVCGGHFGLLSERNDANCANILAARRLVYRYSIFGVNHAHSVGSSGISEIGGNDFMVTLGGWSALALGQVGGRQQAQAGTFMHELGHTLGLGHGGFEHNNCKPNYLSIMNYTRQFPNYIPNRPLDYSRQILPPIDERAASEVVGVAGPAGTFTVYGVPVQLDLDGDGIFESIIYQPRITPLNRPVDWNNDGDAVDVGVAADVNRIDEIGSCRVAHLDLLNGSEDWSRLLYNFRYSADFADGLASTSSEPDLTSDEAVAGALSVDFDNDGHSNAEDNCPATANPDQQDTDQNGIGDACQTSGKGDFDDNGQLNAVDIDLLCAAIRADDDDGIFDVDESGSLDEGDMQFLLTQILHTASGDANLDGIFNSSDLVLVFQKGQYEDSIEGNSGWADGDWNCDGEFDTSDLVKAFQSGGYSSEARVGSTGKRVQGSGKTPDTLERPARLHSQRKPYSALIRAASRPLR
ncbi:MAG: right-handed parallel beta-helix repeat-containing protein [Planctomycetales bacterium]|nr:right-handed parallel beta-helix repeat-containing protein [Planctomycetales bacterium]